MRICERKATVKLFWETNKINKNKIKSSSGTYSWAHRRRKNHFNTLLLSLQFNQCCWVICRQLPCIVFIEQYLEFAIRATRDWTIDKSFFPLKNCEHIHLSAAKSSEAWSALLYSIMTSFSIRYTIWLDMLVSMFKMLRNDKLNCDSKQLLLLTFRTEPGNQKEKKKATQRQRQRQQQDAQLQ